MVRKDYKGLENILKNVQHASQSCECKVEVLGDFILPQPEGQNGGEQQMLTWLWGKGSIYSLFVDVQPGTAAMEISV